MPHDSDFVSRVIAVVKAIPAGTVLTYGQVAALVESQGARAVGYVMAHYGSELPWWCVVRAGGHPPIGHESRALVHYRDEGTPLTVAADGRYRVTPTERLS